MGTISVPVPTNGNSKTSSGWAYDVSQHIDAGDDVIFVDEADTSIGVEVSKVHLNSDGHIGMYGRGATSAAAVSMSFAGGGLHVVGGVHGIVAAETSIGVGIHVKL